MVLDKKYYEIRQDKNPAIVKIIPSGWDDKWHVITEDPEKGDYHYKHTFISKNKVEKLFNIEI